MLAEEPETSGRRGHGDPLAELLAGNRRFVRNEPRCRRPHPGHGSQQRPVAAVVGCMDGRVPLETAFDQDVGGICAIRSGGHVLDRAVLGSVELAATALGVELVLVLGHSRCAAVAAAMTAVRTGEASAGERGYVIDGIAPAVRDAGADPSADGVTRAHVQRTVSALQRHLGGAPTVAGAVYDLDTGRVALVD